MTLAEYERASLAPSHRLPGLSQPLWLMLFVGPTLVFVFERRFPQRGMSRGVILSVVLTKVALVTWGAGWGELVGWQSYLIIQGTTLIAGGAIAAWMLYIQHQYEETYYESGDA